MKEQLIRALKWGGVCIALVLSVWGVWACRAALGDWLFQASAAIQAIGSVAAAIAAFCAWRTSGRGTEAAIASAKAAALSVEVAKRIAEIEEWNLSRNAEFVASANLHYQEGDRAPVLRFEMDNPVKCLCKSAVCTVYARYYRVRENQSFTEIKGKYSLLERHQEISKDGSFSIDVGNLIETACFYMDAVLTQDKLPFALRIECEFYFAKGTRTFSRDAAFVVDWHEDQGWFVRLSDWHTVQSQVYGRERVDRRQTGSLADQFPGGPAVGPFRPDLKPPGGWPRDRDTIL